MFTFNKIVAELRHNIIQLVFEPAFPAAGFAGEKPGGADDTRLGTCFDMCPTTLVLASSACGWPCAHADMPRTGASLQAEPVACT